jgi:hypothetical protein
MMCRLSEPTEPAARVYAELHARALACIADVCTSLADSGAALARFGSGSPVSSVGLNLEALAQALLRPPLAHLSSKVRHAHYVPVHPACMANQSMPCVEPSRV